MNKLNILIIIVSTFFCSCFFSKPKTNINTNPIQNKNRTTSSGYNVNRYVLHPELKVFHEKGKNTKLFLKLFTQELHFSRANIEGKFKCKLDVRYEIYPSFRDKSILDSASTSIPIYKIVNQTSMVTYLKLNRIQNKKYIIKVNINDVYGKRKSEDYITVNNTDKDNYQNYISLQENNFKPIFKDYFNKNDKILIQNKSVEAKTMFVKYYAADFQAPLPPFSSIKYRSRDVIPDSIWEIPINNYTASFSSEKKGVFRIMTDTVKNKGVTKINFGTYYPLFKTSQHLLDGLQYLLSTGEYENMKGSDNLKLAVDNFWLKTTGNSAEKARVLIKIWYNRATQANYLFSSYKEGWKTDKGMIYIVFGPPKIVKYDDGAERWSYSNKGNLVHFIFVKNKNSASYNDYVLRRDISHKTYWYKAIDTWRSGKVYHY